MIIEGAFFKLPELLIEGRASDEEYEHTLVSHLAMAVLLEFEARSIQQPLSRIHIERPYPAPPGVRAPARADLFVDLSGLIPDLYHAEYGRYGIKRSNWIEAKLFGRIGSRKGTETKVSNAGLIALDLLRLCLYVPENTFGGPRDNNRYFLSVFDRTPTEYLAFARQSEADPSREWLKALLSPGDNEVTIPFHQEPKSFRSASKSVGMRNSEEMTATFRVVTVQFGPLDPNTRPSYCGFLSRIVGFDIRALGSSLSLEDTVKVTWDQAEDNLQRAIAQRFLGPA
jgi:hypothetical protein